MKVRRPPCFARRAMLLFCSLALFACTQTVGKDFSNTTVRLVKPGVTNKATVARYFGAPQFVMPIPNGEIWRWHVTKIPNLEWPMILSNFVPAGEIIMYAQSKRATTSRALEIRFAGELVASCAVASITVPLSGANDEASGPAHIVTDCEHL